MLLYIIVFGNCYKVIKIRSPVKYSYIVFIATPCYLDLYISKVFMDAL